MQGCLISLNALLPPYFWDEYSVYEKRRSWKELSLETMVSATLAQSYVSSYTFCSKSITFIQNISTLIYHKNWLAVHTILFRF